MEDPPTRFTRLYDRYYRNVLGYALLRAERTTAEDVASETFLIAWRRLGDVPDQPLPWLLGVARNLLYKQYGSHDRNRMLVRQMASLTTAADQAAWDAAEHVIERDTAVAALASLPAQDLEALTLVAWHDLDRGRRLQPPDAPRPPSPSGCTGPAGGSPGPLPRGRAL